MSKIKKQSRKHLPPKIITDIDDSNLNLPYYPKTSKNIAFQKDKANPLISYSNNSHSNRNRSYIKEIEINHLIRINEKFLNLSDTKDLIIKQLTKEIMNLKSEISHLRSETYLLRIKNNQLKSQYKSYRYSSGDEKPKISTLEKKKLILNPNKILDLYTIKDPCNTIFNCSKLSIEKTFFAILNNKLQTPSYSKPDLNDQIQIHPNTNFVSNNETSNVFKKHNTSFEKKNEDNSPKKKFSYCFTVNDFQMSIIY